MKTWLEPLSTPIAGDLREVVGGHPVVAQRLARSGVTTPEAARRFLSAAHYVPAPPDDLPDMDKAVTRVRQAIAQRQHILVWGDFDVDGQTATALLVSALRDLGARVSYHIPNRFSEGHGIALHTLKPLLNGVDLLLTCDTGIAAHEAVSLAHSHMVDVVITDHHTLAPTLPPAEAVVNPMRLEQGHRLRELPGVGTAYQLVRALYGDRSSDHLLDLLAVGIVADVMVLTDDTRYWLQRGLDVLRNAPRPALRAILERAEINPANVTETDIGFSLAPRLNAIGRLADANSVVEMLTSDDPVLIAERVNELEGLNQKRRFLTTQVYEGAQKKIEEDPSLLKYAALVISGEGWHTGVVGIVASRLVEDYNCPVILLSENEGVASGSARSVAGCNIVEAIRTQAHLLNHFGGHTMAAGLSLSADKVYEFRRGLSGVVREAVGKAEVKPQLAIDAYLGLSEINLEFADDIGRLAPFGNGNPALTLATRNVHVKSKRSLGSRGDHLDLKIEDDAGNVQRVVWWFGDVNGVPEGKFDLAYTVRANVFNGKREALVEWVDVRAAEGQRLVFGSDKSAFTVIDYRQRDDQLALLTHVIEQYPDVLVWREGTSEVDGQTRYHLREAQTLVVWTAPPDPVVWHAALNVVRPQTLVLFGHLPIDSPKALLSHVAGMLKYAHRQKEGTVSASEFAGLTGQTEQTIHACFHWFNAKTEFTLSAMTNDVYEVSFEPDRTVAQAGDKPNSLSRLMNEATAYRHFWLKQNF
jgi:single-stranded-DNA-specific exonuclease